MAQQLQEGGWPLGLQPLNVRVGLIRSLDFSGSLSLNTFNTSSPSSSSITSSDLDTESTGSVFHERSITLGNLMGVTSMIEASSRSLRSRRHCDREEKRKRCYKAKACLSLCSRAHLNCTDAAGNAPSLGDFLQVERRAGSAQETRASINYETGGLPETRTDSERTNSLFSDGLIAPPRRGHEEGTNHENGYRFPILPCMK